MKLKKFNKDLMNKIEFTELEASDGRVMICGTLHLEYCAFYKPDLFPDPSKASEIQMVTICNRIMRQLNKYCES